jgi:hypothetical protein
MKNQIYFLMEQTLNLFLLKNNISVSLCPRRFRVSYSPNLPYTKNELIEIIYCFLVCPSVYDQLVDFQTWKAKIIMRKFSMGINCIWDLRFSNSTNIYYTLHKMGYTSCSARNFQFDYILMYLSDILVILMITCLIYMAWNQVSVQCFFRTRILKFQRKKKCFVSQVFFNLEK